MEYTTIIQIKTDKKLYEALLPEINNNKWSRSSFIIKKDKTGIIVEIYAKDITALRATFNNITKLIAVYEKIIEL